jgi:hypothetical protein
VGARVQAAMLIPNSFSDLEQMQTDYVMTCRAKSIIYARRFVKFAAA